LAVPDKEMAISRAWRDSGGARVRPTMLAIAGDSAAGKTTLTRGLTRAVGPDRITAICVDDYHRYDRCERKELSFTPLDPRCNYLDIMEQHLQLLALGQPILKPVYNHSRGVLERPVLVEPKEFVIVEGLLPLHSKLSRACFDVTAYLDPPEEIRRAWKVRRDCTERGYEPTQVLADLERREPDSEAFIRPQRAFADIVVRFSPIEERSEDSSVPLSATLLLRPTIPHPDLSSILTDDHRKAVHLKLMRDRDGRPVDALHIHGYAPRSVADEIALDVWSRIGVAEELPPSLGEVEPGDHSGPLALTQLILLYHMLVARRGAAPGAVRR
jgi:phosphoribulokinase